MRPVCSVSSSGSAGSDGAAPRARSGRLFSAQDLVLRILQLQAVRCQFELAEEDDPLVRMEDVVQERLVEPDRAQRAGLVPHHHLEDLEPRTPRRPQAAADHFPDDRRRHARAQRGDRLERAAVLVADRKPVKQILDGGEADALEVGGAARADPLHELERGLQVESRSWHACGSARHARGYWTIVAVPGATRISRICAGSSNGSSMLIPSGSSAVRE